MLKKIALFLLLCFATQISAQVVRSHKLIEYAGYKYYIHQVKKQDTLYAISKAYGVSIGSIKALNNKKNTRLQEGELLRIPVVKSVAVHSKFKKHKVKKGETVYALSKKYGVSKQDLIAANKGIKSILKEGQIVNIPPKKEARYDQQYYYHIVKRGETLSSIARNYNMTLRKLRKVNKDSKPETLKPNDEIKIPISKASTEVAMLRIRKKNAEKNTTTNEVANSEEKPDETILDKDIPLATELKNSYNLLLLLPLKDSWEGMKNYYKGMLVAVEQNKAYPNFNVNLQVHDTQKSIYKTKVALSNYGQHADFILGPYTHKLFSVALPYANDKTTVVSLLSKNDAVFKKKNVLQISTTEKTVNKKIASYVIENYSKENIICSNAVGFVKYRLLDTLDNAGKVKKLADKLNVIQDQISYDFKTDYSKEFEVLLDKEKKNIIIVSENDRKIVGQVLSALDIFRDYKIEVIGYYKWKFFTTLEPDLFYRLNVTFFTPFYYAIEDESSFIRAYAREFESYPDEFSFMGYKTMKKLLDGMRTGGTHFYGNLPSIIKYENGGFENVKLYKITFRDDYSIVVE